MVAEQKVSNEFFRSAWNISHLNDRSLVDPDRLAMAGHFEGRTCRRTDANKDAKSTLGVNKRYPVAKEGELSALTDQRLTEPDSQFGTDAAK